MDRYTQTDNHTLFMRRCIDLAKIGMSHVAPNPMVGSIVVHKGTVVGEGYHERYGDAHAEVNAISSVVDRELLTQATLYVNLEPCSHQGKTPPCADYIITQGIPRVVVGAKDVNPEVSGRGITKLREAGVEVITDVLGSECEELNKRFYTFHREKRPYIVLKWAETADGFIAKDDYSSKWISSEESRRLVHKWRGEEAAILVGTNTALYDNPKLTVRNVEGVNPIRVFIDKEQKIPTSHHLYNGEVQTLLFTEDPKSALGSVTALQYSPYISQIVDTLYAHNIQSILVEGGAKILQSFISAGLWDEARIFSCASTFESGIRAPDLINADLTSRKTITGGDQLAYYLNRPPSP